MRVAPNQHQYRANKCSNTIEITAGRSVDFLEIDAASNAQVEKIRDLIETVEYKPAKGRYKIFSSMKFISFTAEFQSFKDLRRTTASCCIYICNNQSKKFQRQFNQVLQLNLKTVNEEMLNNP